MSSIILTFLLCILLYFSIARMVSKATAIWHGNSCRRIAEQLNKLHGAFSKFRCKRRLVRGISRLRGH